MNQATVAGAWPVIFAACDIAYFRKHALGFCRSALKVGHDVHIMISPKPGPEVNERAEFLSQRVIPQFLAKFDRYERSRLTVEAVVDERASRAMPPAQETVFYQSLRFFQLPALLKRYQRPIITMDIDSLIRAALPPQPGADLGIYLRLSNEQGNNEYERLGMMVLAAMVYAAPTSAGFFDQVSAYLDTHEWRRYIDQRAIYEVFLSQDDYRIFDLAESGWLDWHFSPTTPVWTAKGKRLRRNLTYVRERMLIEGRTGLYTALMLVGYRLGIIRT